MAKMTISGLRKNLGNSVRIEEMIGKLNEDEKGFYLGFSISGQGI